MEPLVVIGVGNDFRGDDAAGLLAARRLHACRGVRTVEHTRDGLSLMEHWRPADRVVVVDALCSGHSPGTVFRFDATAGPVPGDAGWVSSHTPGVAEGIETARILGRLPAALTVYGIEAAQVDPGADVTPAVARAVEEVALAILEETGRA
ncbi:MAG TPA: hydrogenase maturation protease [Thermoanaerobaculia bacterium]|nr:hydrogenase maturation protease [Thermoanaerobaculia bacterium]